MYFPLGLVAFTGHATSPILKDFHILFSVIVGIFMCKTVYELTSVVSSILFKCYGNFKEPQKVEWNNRGFSTFHALIGAAGSFYLLVLSDLFDEDSYGVLIINRKSTLSDIILGISIGYFLSDLSMILWHFPALGGLEYVLHHVLSMFSIFLSLVSGQGRIYILMILFSEVTTPFVNLRWYLEIAGQKKSNYYVCNGVALFLGWLVARVLWFIFIFYHMFIHFDQIKTVFPLGFYSLLTIPPVLGMMNLFWFWRIVRGLIKTLSKARHTQ